MTRAVWIVVGVAVAGMVVVVLALTAALTPQGTHPAYAAAVAFAEAAGRGEDERAAGLMDEGLRAFTRASCPEGKVSRCVEEYIPDAWGGFQSVVFRRAAPDTATMRDGAPRAFDVDLIATYARDKGFSGVCIYTRMEADAAGVWRVAGYAGFISCGDAESRSMAGNPDAPNRAP